MNRKIGYCTTNKMVCIESLEKAKRNIWRADSRPFANFAIRLASDLDISPKAKTRLLSSIRTGLYWYSRCDMRKARANWSYAVGILRNSYEGNLYKSRYWSRRGNW